MSTLKTDKNTQKMGLVPTATGCAAAFYKAPLETVGVVSQTLPGFLGLLILVGSICLISFYLIPLKHHPRCLKSIKYKRNLCLISIIGVGLGVILITSAYKSYALQVNLEAAHEVKYYVPHALKQVSQYTSWIINWIKSFFN